MESAITAFTPQLQNITLHFGWYSFFIPLMVEGCVGLGG